MMLALLFPPYGSKVLIRMDRIESDYCYKFCSEEIIPWRYVQHKFIYSSPPKGKQQSSVLTDAFRYSAFWEDPAVSWTFIAVEIGIIVLVAASLLYSTRSKG
jgi:hypothetical protein